MDTQDSVVRGRGMPQAVVDTVTRYLSGVPDPRYTPSELQTLAEAVAALAASFCPAAELTWELAVAPYLQIRLADGTRSDLVLMTPAG